MVGLCCATLARLTGMLLAKLSKPARWLRLDRRLTVRMVICLLLLLTRPLAGLFRLRLLRSELAQNWIHFVIVVERATSVQVHVLLVGRTEFL